MKNLFLALCTLFFFACSHTPKSSSESISSEEAQNWLKQFCSAGPRDLAGELVVKSNTREFKGQFPASIRVEKTKAFQLEVTNILGGTMLQLLSHGSALEVKVPSKPKLNQSGVTHYLGLELEVLRALLQGDLPCPSHQNKVRVQGNQVQLLTEMWKWGFERAAPAQSEVPVRVVLTATHNPNYQIDVKIEEWDLSQGFARKVSIVSPEGEIKWTWRNRH